MTTPLDDPTSLGSLLLAAGVIDIEGLQFGVTHARTTTRERQATNPRAKPMLLGEALLDLGLLDKRLLTTVLSQQRAERASSAPARATATSAMTESAMRVTLQLHSTLDMLQATVSAIAAGITYEEE